MKSEDPTPLPLVPPAGPVRTAAVLALAAGTVAALVPGRIPAAAAGALAILALVAAYRAPVSRTLRRLVPLVAFAVVAAVGLELLVPVPAPNTLLADATAHVEQRWQELRTQLAGVVHEPPPASGDAGWIERRAARLGERAGIALLEADGRNVVAWGGWTTPLATREREVLLARIDHGPVLLVLRRGLTLRLLYAEHVPGRDRLILAAERPLPPEPDPGPLAAGLDPAVHALVRWEALGEGLRAPVETDDSASGATAFWSLVPLMSSPGEPAARVSLGAAPREDLVARADDRRRTWCALALAAALVALVLGGARPAIVPLVIARGVLLAACSGLDAWSRALGVAPWPHLPPSGGFLGHLVHTPLDAALTGLVVLGAAALWPRATTLRGRLATGIAGTTLFGLGLLLVERITVRAAIDPGEVLVPGGLPIERVLVVTALGALPVAGAILLCAASASAARLAALWGALVGGGTAGLVQVAAVESAARYDAEHDVSPQVTARYRLWTAALLDTLAMAAPPTGPEQLVPERDAIDLWWNSPLGRDGLAAGVWKFGPPGANGAWVLEDSFLTGLPPVLPSPGKDGVPLPDARTSTVAGPIPVALHFLGGQSRLVLAIVARPQGGAWVAAVLDEPRNVPVTAARAGRAIRAASDPQQARSPFLAAHLAWFDRSNRLVGSDLETGPPVPRSRPSAPRWRSLTIEDRPAQVLEFPDGDGTVALAYFSPGPLVRAAVAVDRAAVFGIELLLLAAAAALFSSPRLALRSMRRALHGVATHFRLQVPLILVVAGLLPLLAFGIAGRVVAARVASMQLVEEGATVAHNAANLIRDLLTLPPVKPVHLDDTNANWIARSIGNDLFVWEDGELIATSRPDLVRAGFWPERLLGRTWSEVASGHSPLLIEGPQRGTALFGVRPALVDAPFVASDGDTGVLTVSLARTGRRIEENRLTLDRALLVSTALLVALASLLLTHATRRIVRPLAELEAETSRIAGGDFATPVRETGYEETRALARAFQSMAASLEDQRARLEARRAAIETLIARMPVAVLAVTRDGIVSASNPRATELLGVEPGRRLEERRDPLGDAVRVLLRQSAEGTQTVDLVADGRSRHLRAVGIDLPGLVEGAATRLIVIEDLTDAVRSERLTAWAEMARRIAHEIKNPLTPISLVVEHVRRLIEEHDADLPQALERALRTIGEQVAVLKETSREFSDYARLLVAKPEPLAIPELLRRWLAPYVLAPPPGIELRLDGPGELPLLQGDPRLIRRAVVNLVDNALAAVQDGGTVSLSWGVLDAPEPSLYIEVADDGPGIDPERLGRIFETGETTRDTGSGLGLPIALQAVLAHGGRIDVANGPRSGARFTIVLPYRREAEPAPSGPAAPQPIA